MIDSSLYCSAQRDRLAEKMGYWNINPMKNVISLFCPWLVVVSSDVAS